jgi:hypothetical protein
MHLLHDLAPKVNDTIKKNTLESLPKRDDFGRSHRIFPHSGFAVTPP